jgi:hypothetical protein
MMNNGIPAPFSTFFRRRVARRRDNYTSEVPPSEHVYLMS